MTTISTPTSVAQGGPAIVNTQGFRYFRVYKTGNSGGDTSNLLHIAAIELYGVLIEAPAPAPGTIMR